METAARHQPSPLPIAELVGLQFGLATSNEFLGYSVLNSRSKEPISSLVDPRLGLPAEDERCGTCGGTNYDECTGHFAHVKLTQPIFHPNHMRLVQRILQKICLACGIPKVKKMKTPSDEAINWKRNSRDNDSEDSYADREHPVVLEADPIEKDADGSVILLSSDEEEEVLPLDILRIAPNGPMDFLIGSASQSAVANLPQLRSRKSKGKAHVNGSSHVEPTTNGGKKSASKKSGSTQDAAKIYKGTPAGLDVLIADTLRTARPLNTPTCPHCSPGYPDYRSILVKILPVKGRKKDDVSEILLLEVQGSDKEEDFELPQDFWVSVNGATYPEDEEVPKRHVLSPSEALTVLKKIPERAIGKLGMNGLVARPEGLIMKCVPIPPNCTRTPDYNYVNNTTAVRFGTDKVTRTLQNLVTEIGRIQKTRTGKAMKRGQRDESKALQILAAEYLREKGAPKAVPGREPVKKDRNGRYAKQDDHRWTKEWLSQNILGKGGNHTARAVIAGDPFLGIEQIGVPLEIAQKLTIPERATQWNCKKLQEYVNRTQTLQQWSGKPGSTRIERNGEAFQVWANSTHKVQIGDVVHRNILDGDFVYVNRPPSVHKHSLMALRVSIHYGLVLTVNPLVCPPFNADFDGDIFHIFIPQSLQAIAELEQLMSVQQQIVSDHGGQPLLGLTQDTLLAAHLLTTSKLLVDKASMDQLCLWSSNQPPEAAILKSPKGGPFWTGEQVFGLTLPADLTLGAPEEGIFIEGGQIMKWNDGTKMLRKDSKGIASALCVQLGPVALVDYLNTATGLLHAWLHVQGFSTGLTDFQVTDNLAERQKMLKSIFEEYYLKSIQESCDSVRILDAKVQAMGPDISSSPDSLTKNVRFLEQTAQQIFRARETEAESIVVKYAEKNNSLLQMVNSGSKGSRGKLLQQVAGMGLQLYKGQHLLPFSSSRRPSTSNSPVLDWWEDKGLVQSSLVDGLNASELFNHVIADRTGILRKHVEVVQPGTLFKSLMLFLRDLHVMYDGSVRSQCGKNLVQFCYGGAVGVARRTVPKEGSIWSQFGLEDPTTPAEGPVTWEEDDLRRWPLSGLAGEPVGVLAATAISQPAYDCMLDAPSLNGPFKPRPLELVQETLYPREKSDLKPADRTVIIRLVNCRCTQPLCLERRVLDVQAHLKNITLKTVAQSSAIEFWNMEDFGLAGPSGEALRLGSPWLGHIKLSLDMMEHHQVDVDDIVQRLRQKFSGNIKNPKKHPMGQIFFCHSRNCGISNGYCLHFSPRLPSKMQNQRNDEIYNTALLALLTKIRGTVIPGLLDCTVKGDERLESIRIVSEGSSWTTWHSRLPYNRDLDEELILEIVVSPTKSKSKRSDAWASVKQACLPLMDMVDWNRSMPYSIQEIRHALGVEVAYQMVTRRLGFVLEKTAPHTNPVHVKLIADMMTFSGDANGFTFSGFQDMNKSTGISAPFTEASFQKPIKTLLDAAGRGATDSVEGVLTSCVWGKEAPLGTGSNFEMFWQPSQDKRRIATSRIAIKDVHMIWKDLDEKCIPDKVIPPSPTHSLPGLRILPEGDLDVDDGAGFSPQHASNGNDPDDVWGSSHQNNSGDHGAWGDSPVAKEDDGGWGAVGAASDGKELGGWDHCDLTDGSTGQGGGDKPAGEEGGWGSVGNKKGMSENNWDDNGKEDAQGGWGNGAREPSNEGGWDSLSQKTRNEGGWDSGSNEKGMRGRDRNGNRKGDAQRGWGGGAAGTSNETGWGSGGKEKDISGNAWDNNSKEDAQGGWGGGAAETSNEGGWGSGGKEKVTSGDAWDDNSKEDAQGELGGGAAGTSNEGGWGSVSKEKGTTSGVGNSGGWGTSSVQESGRGGWDSLSTDVGASDGWDSFSVPRAKSPKYIGSEHTDHRHRSGVENNFSQERHFRARGEENRGGGRTWTSRGGDRGRGRGRFEKDWNSSGNISGANERSSGAGSRREHTAWGQGGNTSRSSHGDDVPTSSNTPTRRDEKWSEPHPEPECKEIDDLVKSIRRILFNLNNELGGRLSDEDDEAVQAVLLYHPKYSEKAGCGTAYIKVDKSPNFSENRCFWLVRTDGSEVDFSYHKCLKEKVSREFPSFVDRYDDVYAGGRRLLAPAADLTGGRLVDQREDLDTQPPDNSTVENSRDEQREDLGTQPPDNFSEVNRPDEQREDLDTQPAENSTEGNRPDEQREDLDKPGDQE